MKTIAFFNNKGGVGKTTLVYHLAHMFARLGYRTVAADLDPQANLTSGFFSEEQLEQLWNEAGQNTILGCIDPILEGLGDIRIPKLQNIAEALWILPGDLGLSRFEDRLASAWAGASQADVADLRATSAFYRLLEQAAEDVKAAVALLDVGPNLGAINRSALLAADYLIIPLAADLFSLQGMRNLGPTIREWRRKWQQVRRDVPPAVAQRVTLPEGKMAPAGYIVLQHAVRLDRPVRAYEKWLRRIPEVYRKSVLEEVSSDASHDERHRLATLKNFRSLMPMAQEARKPIFDLRPADGAIGSHASLVRSFESEFRSLARKIVQVCELEPDSISSS